MEVSCKLDWDKKTKKGLERIPKEILVAVAKQTLDMSIPMIPMSNTKGHSGTLRRSSGRGESGVHLTSDGCYIGSFTNYASSVWKMNDTTTNWTTPGTHSQWFARTLKRNGTTIINNAINQSWKETM